MDINLYNRLNCANINLINLFLSEIFKFLYIKNLNINNFKKLSLAYTLSNDKILIFKNVFYNYNINSNLLLIQSKYNININIYLYKNKNRLFTIAYNYITNKVISIYEN